MSDIQIYKKQGNSYIAQFPQTTIPNVIGLQQELDQKRSIDTGTTEWVPGNLFPGTASISYRRWIHYTMPNSTAIQTIPHNIANVNMVYPVTGFLWQTSNVCLPLPFLPNTAANCIVLTVDRTNITLQTNGIARPGDAWVLFEYCCTDR